MTNVNKIKSLDKYYNIAKIFLTITPFLYIMYLCIGATRIGIPISQLIQEDPKNIVVFLVAMINPFIAYLLSFMHRKINNGDVAYSVVNLIVLIIGEVMLQNVLYIILLVFLLLKTLKIYNYSIKECFKTKWNKDFFSTISGGLIVIGLASICLFAIFRINS
ncbi:hypothetical protein [Clostridium beijerinckii]|uniref:hypothetical protein n=1 Tax=Clostridium beijerinckii TaxID=1520 RepID=UPI00030C0760|nr:hypothetical protein [Clostridium beijerinckii]